VADPKPLRIVRLEAANVKRLTAVEITPDGNLVLIGGRNDQGKTSVLDSIAYALGGAQLVPDQPLRKGAEHGHVEVDLGDLVVRRTFTPSGGGTLTVGNKEGAVYKSPQTILDKLVGRLSFDPLNFARMSPREQREMLRALVGLDFSALDAKRLGLFEERTAVNRATKALEARLAAMAEHPDAPAELVNVADLVEELEDADAASQAADNLDRETRVLVGKADSLRDEEAGIARRVAAIEEKIRELEAFASDFVKQSAAKRKLRETCQEQVEASEAKAKAAREALPDPAPIRARIAAADGINAKVRANAARAALALEAGVSASDAEKLTAAIDALDASKAQALAGATFPVPGLSFDESGVTLNGFAFSEASGAQQLRVSVAMAAAMNPRVRIALVRDGSLLDSDSMRLLAALAEEHGLQVWLEVVSENGEGCQVVIEDGAVRGAVAPEVAA